jgi:dTDP-4-amino-4,6-dideoxygalactose transaminase
MAKLALLGGTPVRAAPYMQWPYADEQEIGAVTEILLSGKWGRYEGEKAVEFENAFAKAHGAKYAVAVTNGSAALEIALAAMGVGPGDEVIVPSYTFVASATAIVMNGATPVFADVEPDTYNLDPACFEAAITEKTKAVIPVHFAGFPCDMDKILSIAEKHNLYILEDAAHAHGGAYKGKMMGSIGDAGAFSFQTTKNMTAGEGGACITDDEALAGGIYSRHTLGRVPGRPWYEHTVVGTNARMTEIQAAILLAQLSRLTKQTAERARNAAILDKRIGAFPDEFGLMRLCDADTEKRAYHLYMFRYLSGGALEGVGREAFIRAMHAEGADVSPGYFIPLYKQAVFQPLAWGSRQTSGYGQMYHPAAEKAVVESLWLPQQALLGDGSQVEDIAAAIEKIIANADELRGYDKK